MEHPFMRSGAGEQTVVPGDCPGAEPEILPARLTLELLSPFAKEGEAKSPVDAFDAPVARHARTEIGIGYPKPEKNTFPIIPVGRRAAPRLRISLPGKLIAVEKCIRAS